MRRLVVVGVALGGLLACKPTGSSGDDTDGGGTQDTGDGPSVGDNQVAVVTHVDGVDTSFTCDLGVDPGSSGSIEVAGSTRRLRAACIEIVGQRGQHMASLLIERDDADFAAGAYDVGRDAGDMLAVVLTDENGDGWQFVTTSSGTSGWSGWSGDMQLDEVGAEGGGTVTGSMHGSWDTMQEMADGMPTGEPVARAGTVDVAFDFTRP